MIGETANGRSTNPSTSVFPQNFCRTRTTAKAIPKRVFTTVATNVMPRVSLNAVIASGEDTASQKGLNPPEKAPRTRANVGTRIKTPNQMRTADVSRYCPSLRRRRRSVTRGVWSSSAMRMLPAALLQAVQDDEHPQRACEQDRGNHHRPV